MESGVWINGAWVPKEEADRVGEYDCFHAEGGHTEYPYKAWWMKEEPMPQRSSPESTLNIAAKTIKERAETRNLDKERAMHKTVSLFNTLTGHRLTETEGWKFMVLLKLARASCGPYREDDYVDGAAYVALAGECHAFQDEINK